MTAAEWCGWCGCAAGRPCTCRRQCADANHRPEPELPPWRRPDGTVIWCNQPCPLPAPRYPVHCARVIGHDGEHRNGTWAWPA